uniref:chalcone isomerase family protein n=1 Tax=Castellaniella defragrans TaxID=75697 RepID=UPI00333EF045
MGCRYGKRHARSLALMLGLAGLLGGGGSHAAGWSGFDVIARHVLAAADAAGAPAMEIAGVPIAGQRDVQGHTLVLNGAGLRKRFVFDVYVAALYVGQKTQDAGALIRSDQLRRMTLTLLRDIDSKTLADALNEGLRDNTSAEELAGLQPSIDAFMDIMNKGGEGRTGDVIDLDMDASGVSVSFQGTVLGTVQDPRFGSALLRVWLGEKPAQSSLRKALLGQE